MRNFRALISAALCLVGFCAIAVVFKVFPLRELPASFIGAALGAVITGVVTVVLLEGQSKAEEIKERNVKVFEQKSAIFQEYINQVWRIWEDQKITAEEFQSLTASYYSKLMIFLKYDSVGKISDSLAKMGDCIDKETLEDYITLRSNVIKIINTLSEEINLGGKIDEKRVEELDSKMFPVIFKKILVKEFTKELSENRGLFSKPQLRRGYSQNLEYLMFNFRKYPRCKVVIGPFDRVSQIKIGLDITRQLHQFDKFRQPIKKYSYWIKTIRGDTGNDLVLNERLPQEEDADEIENGIHLGVISKFGFNDAKSLEQYRVNFRNIATLLAKRAEYYLNAVTINKEFSMAELPETILGPNAPKAL
jgi:hypothetical protein